MSGFTSLNYPVQVVAWLAKLGCSEAYSQLYNGQSPTGAVVQGSLRCCQYQQGKLAFDVLSLFYGPGEVKLASAATQITARIAGFAAVFNKLRLPSSLILRPLKSLATPLLAITLTATPAKALMSVERAATTVSGALVRVLEAETVPLAADLAKAAALKQGPIVARGVLGEVDMLGLNGGRLSGAGAVRVAQEVAGDATLLSEQAGSSVLRPLLLIYATGRVVQLAEEALQCEVCKAHSQPVCDAYQQVRDKAVSAGMAKIDAETAVNKMCSAITDEPNLLSMAGTLNTTFTAAQVSQWLTDINPTSCSTNEVCGHLAELNTARLSSWQYLVQNQAKQAPYARKYWPTLTTFSQLSSGVQTEIVKFSDSDNTTSTLKEFSDDLTKTTGFIDFLNQHIDFAKGFVGHKQSPLYTAQDYEGLDEAIKDIPISTDLLNEVVAWLAYSKEDAQRRNYYQQGKDFENRIGSELRSSSSAVYQALKNQYIPDLDQRQILSQVQFCIYSSPPCSEEGQYFIADFVFVKESVDNRGNPIWDIIVADTKLQSTTAFTPNQKQAMLRSGYQIKVPKTEDINGIPINFSSTTSPSQSVIKTTTKFLKIYSNGSGSFGGLTQ